MSYVGTSPQLKQSASIYIYVIYIIHIGWICRIIRRRISECELDFAQLLRSKILRSFSSGPLGQSLAGSVNWFKP